MTTHGQNDDLKRLRRNIESQMHTTHDRWRKLAAGLGPTAREVWRTYEHAARELRVVSDTAAQRVKQLREDDLLPDAGRRRLIDEARSEGTKARAAARARMKAAREVLAAKARVAALPKLSPEREQAAREELRLLTSGTNDPADVLLELATGDDELAAVAVSGYAESLLRAKGVPSAPAVYAAVCDHAVDAARRSADPARQVAAAAHVALGELDRAMSCAEAAANAMLEDEGVELP